MAEERKILLEISSDKVRGLIDDQRITDKNGLMYPAYRAALGSLRSILDGTAAWDSLGKHTPQCASGDDTHSSLYGFSGNVIAFCAERGQGKTSAMLSFSGALSRCNTPNDDEDWSDWSDIHDGKHYYVLPPIDPTMLSDGESVIELFLARLFQCIAKKWDEISRPQGVSPAAWEEEKLDILKWFQKCRQCLGQKQEPSEDEFDHFSRTGSIFELKEHICLILKSFFKLEGKSAESSYMIIQLDDTDMQLENAFNTLDEVRKYLSIPHVVILMATNLRQLQLLVAQHYMEELKLSKNSFIQLFEDRDISRMAAKYIDKLIPASQAIHLPTIQLNWDSNEPVFLKASDATQADDPRELESAIFALAYEKTGIVFIKHSTYLHNILPSTLRGLAHLYQFLDSMACPRNLLPATLDDPTKEDETYYRALISVAQQYLVNLNLFESYFLNDWCASRLKLEDQRLIREINEAYALQRPQRIVELLRARYPEDNIKSPASSAASYFDVLAILESLSQNSEGIANLRLFYAIHIYLSIQFHKKMRAEQIACLDKRIQTIRESPVAVEDPFVFRYERLLENLHLSEPDNQMLWDDQSDLSRWRDDYIKYLAWIEEHKRIPPVSDKEFYNIMYSLMQLCRIDVNEATDSRDIGGSLRSVRNLQNYALYVLANWDVQEEIANHKIIPGGTPKTIDYIHEVLKSKNADGLPEKSIRDLLGDIIRPDLPDTPALDRSKLEALLEATQTLRKYMDNINADQNYSQLLSPLYAKCDELLRDAVPDLENRALLDMKLEYARHSASLTAAKGQITRLIRLILDMLQGK